MNRDSELPGWRDRLLAAFWRKRWRGFLTLRRFLKPPRESGIRARTRYGGLFLLEPGDVIDSHVLVDGFYESEVLEAVRPFLGPGSVLWVIGANFGLHAITAKRLHPEARVIAFEPSPRTAARFIENCQLNGVEIDLHSYALAARDAVLPFFLNSSGNPGMSTLVPAGDADYDHRILVPTRTAAGLVAEKFAPAPTAVIVDAEGAEFEVLSGFRSLLSNPTLEIVVFEARNDFADSTEPEAFRALLRTAGFTLRRLDRREPTSHGLSNFAATRA